MKLQKSKRIIFNFTLSFCTLFFAFCIFAVNAANAATLYFSPSSGDYTVGNILNASILVNTQGKAINNSDAVINFPSALLEVVSLSKSGSIFTLWVEEPSFSNSAGTISFNGGLPTPGFNGSSGRLLNITFQVRNAGLASLIFSSGTVRANDGYGTDILQTRAQAQFNLVSEERPVTPPPPALGTPQAPGISSPTHPDSSKWYRESTATFNWSVPSGVDAARLLVGRIPTAVPVVLYVPEISQKTIEDLGEGVWYFSAQLRNNAGWGPVGRFRFQIDTEKPERFDILLAPREDPTDPSVSFIFEASDRTSGIDYYEVRINNRESKIWRDDGTGIYQTQMPESGRHTLIVKAVDKAGNELQNSIEFNVEALDAPVITEYPREIQSGDLLVIRGSTYPESKVTVFLRDSSILSFNTKSNREGVFMLVTDDRLKDGIYKVWAEVEDSRGARSGPSEEVTIIVRPPTIIRIGTFAIGFLSVLLPLLGLIIILIFILWYGWHKFKTLKKRIRKEVSDVERDLHKAFDLLREDIREQIKMLEKAKTRRQLTEEEEKIIKQLKRDLDDAEKFIGKEIEDIEKEVK